MPVSAPLMDALAERLTSDPTVNERPRLIALIRRLNRNAAGPPEQLVRLSRRLVEASEPEDARRAASAAAALAELDEWTPALNGLVHSSDPTSRAEMLVALETADLGLHARLQTLERQPTDSVRPGVREGLLTALASIDVKRVNDAEQHRLEQLVRKVVVDPQESNESRAIGSWLLSHWGLLSGEERAAACQRMIVLTLPDDEVGTTETGPWRFEIGSVRSRMRSSSVFARTILMTVRPRSPSLARSTK